MLIGSLKKIIVHTRKGNEIQNEQIGNLNIEFRHEQKLRHFKSKYPDIIDRTGVSFIYNCHGMMFASRRTNIYEINENILNEDGYAEISIRETMPGDLIVYIDMGSGDFSHSGMLLNGYKVKEDDIFLPWVLSKWAECGEFIHKFDDCPYFKDSFIKYFRIKK